MKWERLIMEMENNVISIAQNAILDMITPLRSEGVSSIGINQVVSTLKMNPDLSSVNVDSNLIQTAIDGMDGLSVSTDAGGDLNLNIGSISDVSPDSLKEPDSSSMNKVDAAASRAAKKDM